MYSKDDPDSLAKDSRDRARGDRASGVVIGQAGSCRGRAGVPNIVNLLLCPVYETGKGCWRAVQRRKSGTPATTVRYASPNTVLPRQSARCAHLTGRGEGLPQQKEEKNEGKNQ
ncbi:hypothetical protein AWENTII_002944 [Aspergillus wentii]